MLLVARDEAGQSEVLDDLARKRLQLKAGSNRLQIPGARGNLDSVLELPENRAMKSIAVFAHCFTCGKDFPAATRISRALAGRGIATVRLDFSGVGKSCGDFAETSFLTNVDDLLTAIAWLQENLESPTLLVGHSLGGAAVYPVAARVAAINAVVSIGAPSQPAHVTHLFDEHLKTIQTDGEAEGALGSELAQRRHQGNGQGS